MVKVASVQFILYLLLFFACFLLVIPKKPILYVAIPERTQNSSQPLPRVFLLNPQTLAANNARVQAKDPSIMPAYNNLITQANKLLTQKPVSVMDKTQVPPSGNKHDYMSLSTYAWPNPKTKNGLPYIGKDGLTNPEINSIPDAKNLHNMISWTNTLTFAYYFSNNKIYADHAALFINTWFINSKTKMNPNLTFAQIIKGNKVGRPSGIIDTASMPQIIDAIGILNNSGVFSASDKNAIKTWLDEYLKWLQTSNSGKYISVAKNNQRTWYDGQIISIALFLNESELAKQIATNDMRNLISEQIDQEGEQIQELTRTKSWDYSNFNLQALCNLADLSNDVSIDLWHYNSNGGMSLRKAADYLITYAINDKQWPYQQILPFNKHELAAPLFQTASDLNSSRYWEISMDLEGKNAIDNINLLIYQKPY